MKKIYLDYNATTPVAPSVVEIMQPFFGVHYGNPSSAHSLGRASSEAIQDARTKVGGLLGCDSEEVVFTGCGTEANNLAIKGVMFLRTPSVGGHLIISSIEHPSVTGPAKFLERMGYDLTIVDCDSSGYVQPSVVEKAIRPNTRLISIMHANNETGAIQPIRQISEICRGRGILLHTDASQSAGKIATQVEQLGVDLLTIAGHKFYGPKGIGALYVRSGISLEPVNHGAAHENGLRAGTENTPYIVGLGQAAYMAGKCIDETTDRLSKLRDRLRDRLTTDIPELVVHGHQVERLPSTLSVSFPGGRAQEMLRRIPEICVSTGSACHSDDESYSATLTAMGVPVEQIKGTVRLSVGWYTNEEDIDRAASLLIDAWESI